MKSNRTKLLELKKILKNFKGKRIFIGILGSPDPDGIGSAFGLQEIFKHEGILSDILIFERISRPDNTEFVRKLEIELKLIESVSELENYDGYAIVDRQSPQLPVEMTKKIPLIAHIDHHCEKSELALFNDIRVNVGSTSTIITNYFRSGIYSLNKEDPMHKKIATALILGIRTDTDDFFNATQADLTASFYLHFLSDNSLLKKIYFRSVGKAFLETLKNALNNLKRDGTWILTYVGKVPKYARDSIGQTADFLIHSDEVSTVLVYGIVGTSVIGSMRTSDESVDPNQFLNMTLSRTFGENINCGGRKGAGGFQIPLKSFPVTTENDQSNVRDCLEKLLKKCE